ncbi:hypothetical protein PoB_001789000 [Plakobranchus ocellatus]|uniref:Uncharacterized protein n=1 Tax=Plakobranchus ocellatus TaxID=259542 RepID=A0AAV3Z7A1_9GAST|nr:hypothetical protein PoB_001789000 [Plakobranchus ocellatus]
MVTSGFQANDQALASVAGLGSRGKEVPGDLRADLVAMVLPSLSPKGDKEEMTLDCIVKSGVMTKRPPMFGSISKAYVLYCSSPSDFGRPQIIPSLYRYSAD